MKKSFYHRGLYRLSIGREPSHELRSCRTTTSSDSLRAYCALGVVVAALCVAGCSPSNNEAESASSTEQDLASSTESDLSCCPEGQIGVFVNADSDFDPIAESADQETWQKMRSLYEGMVVWRPFFDAYRDEFPAASVYVNAYALYAEPGRDQRLIDHPDWVLRDKEGAALYIDWGCDEPDGCPQYAADIGSRAFRDDLVSRIGVVRDDGYNGVHIDDVNMDWRIAYRDGAEALPNDPRTGEEMTLEHWRGYMAELTEEIRDAFPEMIISHNVIWYSDSPQLDDPMIDRQIRAADFVMLERGANDLGLGAGDEKFGFSTFLRFSDRVHELGGRVLFFDQRAETDDEQWYNLTSLLLVSNGRDMITTSDDSRLDPSTYWKGFDVDLGAGQGQRRTIGDLHTRPFDGGFVLVNEPDAGIRRVVLSGPMHDQHGTLVEALILQQGESVLLTGSLECVTIDVFSKDGDDALESQDWCPGP